MKHIVIVKTYDATTDSRVETEKEMTDAEIEVLQAAGVQIERKSFRDVSQIAAPASTEQE